MAGGPPLREATIVIIVEELKNTLKNVNKPSMVDEQIFLNFYTIF
jgi:hypothetical protein